MERNTSRIKDISVGDIVTHVLYGKEWVGMVIGFKDEDGAFSARNEKALVQIQPGTKFEGFFQSKVSSHNKVNHNLGYVTTNWLFKIEETSEKFRSSRNKAPKSGRKD